MCVYVLHSDLTTAAWSLSFWAALCGREVRPFLSAGAGGNDGKDGKTVILFVALLTQCPRTGPFLRLNSTLNAPSWKKNKKKEGFFPEISSFKRRIGAYW